MSAIEISDVWTHVPNSAGGVGFTHHYKLTGGKPVKYVTFFYVPYNKVGDVVASTVDGESKKKLRLVGPFEDGFFGEAMVDVAWYNTTIHKILITSAKLEYMDGTEETISGEEIAAAGEHVFYEESVWLPEKCTPQDQWGNNVMIRKHITRIAMCAFRHSSTGVSFEEGSLLEVVESRAFDCYRNYKIKQLILPPNTKRIEKNAFINCDTLKKVYVPEGCEIAEGAFDSKTKAIRYSGDPSAVTAEKGGILDKIKGFLGL